MTPVFVVTLTDIFGLIALALVALVFTFIFVSDWVAVRKRRGKQKAKSPYAMHWTNEKDTEKGWE